MIKFGNQYYYIDLGEIDKLVDNDESLKAQEVSETEDIEHFDEGNNLIGREVSTRTYNKGKEIDASKYGTIMFFIETIMDFDLDVDETLGVDRAINKAPLSFKIAFNTLLKFNVLKTIK